MFRIRFSFRRAALSALIILTYAPAAVAQGAPSAEQLIQLERDANARCRGGSGDRQETWQACGERTAYERVLGMMNWCYGKQGEASYQMKWHRCTPNSLRPE